MNRLAVIFAVSVGLTASGDVALAEKRVALVVGNSSYTSTTPLRTPVNDAIDVASALDRLGFEVIRGLDLDNVGMRDKVRLFSERMSGADVGLFYYGGHGIQVSGKNYLVPIDAKLNATSDLDFVAMDLDLVLRNMERETSTNIVFLDACRDNPLVANLAQSIPFAADYVIKFADGSEDRLKVSSDGNSMSGISSVTGFAIGFTVRRRQ